MYCDSGILFCFYVAVRPAGGRVIKGKKLPGRMGNAQVTVQRLTVAKVDVERNLILVKGSIPGAAGSFVVIKETVKPNK